MYQLKQCKRTLSKEKVYPYTDIVFVDPDSTITETNHLILELGNHSFVQVKYPQSESVKEKH
jgi:hypothetical protein